MLRFSTNLNMLFTELSFLARFEAAAEAGFRAVEFLSPFAHDVDALRRAVKATKVVVVQYNFADGDFSKGERGFLSDPYRTSEWRKALEDGIELASVLKPRQLNALAGNRLDQVTREQQIATLLDNVRWALPRLEGAGLPLMLEALNSHDNSGYLLTHSWEVLEILNQLDSPWVQFQYDVYHMQMMEGNLTQTLRTNISRIGHVQIADCPGRNEPGTGEINYGFVLGTLESIGYQRYVGLEYRPLIGTQESLKWLPKTEREETTLAQLLL